jgi:hypothetical protein
MKISSTEHVETGVTELRVDVAGCSCRTGGNRRSADPPVGSERSEPMRVRTLLVLTVLATTAASASAGGAGAATLFTTHVHAARVSVGATASFASTGNVRLTSGTSGSTVENCASSTLNLTVRQNNDTKVILAVTGASFTTCSPFPTVTPTFSGTSSPWTVTISGTGTASGVFRNWNAGLDSVSLDFGNGNYRGSVSGVNAYQIQPDGTPWDQPVCLLLESSGAVIGPITGDGRIDTNYCLEGGAVAWSLTN